MDNKITDIEDRILIVKATFSVRCMTFFLTFHTKSHNMKASVILSHSWSSLLPLTWLYGKNEHLRVSVWPSGVFSGEKTPLILPMRITWPWQPVGSFSRGLITVRQKIKCEHKVVRLVVVYILVSTCQWVHKALVMKILDILLM